LTGTINRSIYSPVYFKWYFLLPSRLYCRHRNLTSSILLCRRSRGLYRRSGISPCPEENCFSFQLQRYNKVRWIYSQPFMFL